MADIGTNSFQKKDTKGWYDIQEGEHLTKLANMVVLDRLRNLGKDNGTTDHANHWKSLNGTNKVAFCLAAQCGQGGQLHVCHRKPCTDQQHEEHHAEKAWLIEAQVDAQDLHQWS